MNKLFTLLAVALIIFTLSVHSFAGDGKEGVGGGSGGSSIAHRTPSTYQGYFENCKDHVNNFTPDLANLQWNPTVKSNNKNFSISSTGEINPENATVLERDAKGKITKIGYKLKFTNDPLNGLETMGTTTFNYDSNDRVAQIRYNYGTDSKKILNSYRAAANDIEKYPNEKLRNIFKQYGLKVAQESVLNISYQKAPEKCLIKNMYTSAKSMPYSTSKEKITIINYNTELCNEAMKIQDEFKVIAPILMTKYKSETQNQIRSIQDMNNRLVANEPQEAVYLDEINALDSNGINTLKTWENIKRTCASIDSEKYKFAEPVISKPLKENKDESSGATQQQ